MALTTNNQMELSAAIEAIINFKLISSEKPYPYITDSKYVIDELIHGFMDGKKITG